MVRVPFDSVDGQIMVFIGLQVQLLATLRAQMDLTLFSSHKEVVWLIFIEIEAHAAGKSVDEWLFLAVSEFLFLVDDELELDDLLRLQLVLHQVTKSDSTVRGDRIEAEAFALGVGVPTHLPDRVCVLIGPHG